MIKSYITQIMQNYFDATDRRSRENSTSLECQLLNMAAVELEDLTMRVNREIKQSLQTVPTNIDNKGVYFFGRVPNSLITDSDQTTFTSVVGQIGATQRTLTPYDDRLPIPTRVELLPAESVAMSNPVMFTLTGSGDSRAQIYTTSYVHPGTFPIPNCLTTWLDQVGLNIVSVTLTIVGETYPQPAWTSERRKTSETLVLTGEGASKTRNRWATIDRIAVRGLPVGARLRGWSMPFSLPATPDVERPHSTPQDRDTLFQRYWQVSNSENLLKEMYRSGGFSGLETINSYLLSDSLVGVAVEPNTNGMYAISQSSLYYLDRREVMPDLTKTGLNVEPLYGLQVSPDLSKSGPTRYVALSGIPYGKASDIFQYRYTVNNTSSILPGGALGPIDAGWIRGAPKDISFPLLSVGNHLFRLEMQDGNGAVTYDAVPYRNMAFSPTKTIDISAIVDKVAGLAFDSYGKLWVWTGSFAIPMALHYDAYSLDVDARAIFVTDVYDTLQVT